jgi:hypothetical protein
VKEPLRDTKSERAAATWRIECNAVAARRKGFVGVGYSNKSSRVGHYGRIRGGVGAL